MKILQEFDHEGEAICLISGDSCQECIFNEKLTDVKRHKCICPDTFDYCQQLGGIWVYKKGLKI